MRIVPRTDILDTYEVYSGTELYDVDLREPHNPTCSCADFLWRDRACRHILGCQNFRDGETDG